MRLLFVGASPPARPLPWLPDEQARLHRLDLPGLKVLPNATPADLSAALLERWDVVHLSVHGDTDSGITLIDPNSPRSGKRLPADWLVRTLQDKNIGGIVLNACHSHELARMHLEHAAGWRVGVEGVLDDEAAPHFSDALYRLLRAGVPVGEAFNAASQSADAQGLAEHHLFGLQSWVAPLPPAPLPDITPLSPAPTGPLPPGWLEMGAAKAPSQEDLEGELIALLCQMFDPRSIRGLIRFLPDGRSLSEDLPEPGLRKRALAEAAVELLSERGRIDQAMFDAMRRRRKEWTAQIDALEQRWGRL